MIAYTDGACSGNPGKMGVGVVLVENGKTVERISMGMGNGTNNRAEYLAIINAIEKAKKMGAKGLEIRTDSELVVKQMNGTYRVKDKNLRELKSRIEKIKERMTITFKHIPREENSEADKLAKKAVKDGD